VIYAQVPEVAQVVPRNSWISLDLSCLTQDSDQRAGGFGGNSVAMLHALALQDNTVTDLGPTTLNRESVHGYSVTLDPTAIQKDVDSANLPAWLKQSVSQVAVAQGAERVYVDGSGRLADAGFSLDESAGSAGTVTLNESLGFNDYGTPRLHCCAPRAIRSFR
jgi:hypothetical protein